MKTLSNNTFIKKQVLLIGIFAFTLFSTPVLAGWDEGVAAFKKGDYSAAAAEFQIIVRQDPYSFAAHYMLGISYEELHKDQLAMRHLQKAHQLNSRSVNVKSDLGRMYFKVNDFRRSIEMNREVIRADAHNTEAHKFLALSLKQVKGKRNALRAFNDHK